MFFNYLIFYKRQTNIPSQHVYKNLFVYCFFLLDHSLNCCNIAYWFLISHIFPSEFFALLASHFLFFPLHTESQVLKNYKKTFFFT